MVVTFKVGRCKCISCGCFWPIPDELWWKIEGNETPVLNPLGWPNQFDGFLSNPLFQQNWFYVQRNDLHHGGSQCNYGSLPGGPNDRTVIFGGSPTGLQYGMGFRISIFMILPNTPDRKTRFEIELFTQNWRIDLIPEDEGGPFPSLKFELPCPAGGTNYGPESWVDIPHEQPFRVFRSGIGPVVWDYVAGVSDIVLTVTDEDPT